MTQTRRKAAPPSWSREPPVSSTFDRLGQAVARQFELISQQPLYSTAVDRDKIWETYLESWPEGSNEVYKTRREHDCTCCRQFIRAVGGVVAIGEDGVRTIWDIEIGGPQQAVADAMAELVRSAAVDNVYLHSEPTVGTRQSRQLTEAGTVLNWHHFFVNLPPRFVADKKSIGPKLSEARAAHDVLLRGLWELTLDSLDTVLELVAQNSLYRGEESRFALTEFRKVKAEWETLRYGMGMQDVLDGKRDCFVWAKSSTLPPAVARIRNTAIGTLLVDLSAGLDLEDAVKKFETSVMAPSSYKRPTALVSKAMIAKAQAAVEELGLASALERRYAVMADVTVNNVLFADRSARLADKDDVFAGLAKAAPERSKRLDRVEEVPIEKFLADVLPKAETLEVMVENKHAGNLVSLVAPCDPTAKRLFKWDNRFSWSYAGEVADAVKDRVKRAGGSVVGDLCCRLAWDYADDLDLHMLEPGSDGRVAPFHGASNHIYYGNVRRLSASGGMLDLDANGCDGMKAEPVENIFYADKARMAEGVYELRVHNYSRRSTGAGFEAQVEFGGVIHSFSYGKALRAGETVTVAKVRYSRAAGFEVVESLPSTQASKPVWGLSTQKFQKASMVMLSPNYWDTWPAKDVPPEHVGTGRSHEYAKQVHGVGNKHWFFMLEGCANEGTARPFYNEFLRADLEPHRKTLEMVGAKLRTDESARQLSGLGFSSTKRDSLTVRVTGSVVRVLKVVF